MMWQGIGTRHWRVTNSKTGVPNQAENNGEKSPDLLGIILSNLSILGEVQEENPGRYFAFMKVPANVHFYTVFNYVSFWIRHCCSLTHIASGTENETKPSAKRVVLPSGGLPSQ